MQSAWHITVAQGNGVIHCCAGDFARGLGCPNWECSEKGSSDVTWNDIYNEYTFALKMHREGD